MKNILLIGSELGKGGAERSISLLSYYLQNHYNTYLCVLSGKDRKQYYPACSNIFFIDPPEAKGFLGKAKSWIYRWKKIKKIKKDYKIDVSISFLEGPDYINILTRGRIKTILSIRGSKIHDAEISGKKGLLRKKLLIPFLYRRADLIVCVSEALKKELHQHFGISKERLKTIYNFYENQKIAAAANEALSEEEKKIFSLPVIISAGRLHMAKEQDKLIRIFKEVKSGMSARLVLLGDGPLKSELLQLARALNLKVCDWEVQHKFQEADVYFMGFQANVFQYYRKSQLFALTSSWEGFPNALAEAMICRIPVMSTDCYTGPREILNLPDLPDKPVEAPIRTKVGSLMPMLSNPSQKTIEQWAQEMIFWLKNPSVDEQETEKRIRRFALPQILNQWRTIIETQNK